MIYRVVLDDTYDLHTSDINCMLLNPSLELEMNSAGSFNFTLPPTHPYWDSIEILKSTIDVYEDDDLIFTGRVANIDKNWNNERVVECEGALAYFNDSIHRQMKWETPLPIASEDPNVHNFLKDILDNHNVFVGDATNRQIHMGHIYVDPYLVTREVDYDTTLDILTRMCIDTNGGYFMIRKDPETHLLYLDWLKDFTEESGQPASFGVNLLDFNTGLHAADICTGVLARGATVNDQVVTLSNVELVDETTYPDMSVDHYTDHDQDILWHREGMAKFGRVVQVHEFPDAQTDWKNAGQVVANSLFEEARKWLEEKNTKVESIEVEVAELAWLQEGVPKYKLGQIVEILDDAHMAGESYEVRRLPMYKLSCDLNSGSKKVTLGRPPKKELTQISASNSDSSTLSSGNSSGSSSGGGSGSGEECKVHDVRVDGTSVVSNKVANISLTGKADVSTVNALAATVDTKADASTVNVLVNVVAGKQDQIEFNTAEAATETLTRLKADGTVYNLGGGTEVEANPSETATDDLTTIKIGNTVYDIPSGGSGGMVMMSDYYSEEEQVVGRWTDGKPIYQKTWDLGQNVIIPPQSWTETPIKLSDYNFDHVVSVVSAENSEKNCSWDFIAANTDATNSQYIRLWSTRSNTTISVRYLTLQYTKTTDQPGTGPTPGNLIYLPALYSEEEREVGVWTDGRPLYQKTIDAGSLSSGQDIQVNAPSNIDKMVGMFGNAHSSNYNQWVNINFPHQNITSYIVTAAYLASTNKINIHTGTDFALDEIYITIQYTKITDQPGSGTWTPEGQLAHHYSTSEKVVGTWIDGSTVYERTWDFSANPVSINYNTWTNTGISIPNINKIISYDTYDSGSVCNSCAGLEFSFSNNNVNAEYTVNSNVRALAYITLRYTKSS